MLIDGGFALRMSRNAERTRESARSRFSRQLNVVISISSLMVIVVSKLSGQQWSHAYVPFMKIPLNGQAYRGRRDCQRR